MRPYHLRAEIRDPRAVADRLHDLIHPQPLVLLHRKDLDVRLLILRPRRVIHGVILEPLDVHQAPARLLVRLLDRLLHVLPFPRGVPAHALAVADDDERGEGHDAALLRHLTRSIHVDHLAHELLRLRRALALELLLREEYRLQPRPLQRLAHQEPLLLLRRSLDLLRDLFVRAIHRRGVEHRDVPRVVVRPRIVVAVSPARARRRRRREPARRERRRRRPPRRRGRRRR
mmetsp:Transcript_108/g.348  ORF Transcript_108/g.348 Transcript_108/m.348 type:complete len:230 (+) Transcript_108:175-864(+)